MQKAMSVEYEPASEPLHISGQVLSHTVYRFNAFSKSSFLQNRQLIVLISDSKQQVEDFVGELTF